MNKLKEIIDNWQGMYFDPEIAKLFVDRERDYEHNHEHIWTSRVFESIILYFMNKWNFKNPKVANLWAWSNPDEFPKLLKSLPPQSFDRVDASPYMIELAQQYLWNIDPDYQDRLNPIQADFLDYIQNAEDGSLDFIFMQYTFNWVIDSKNFFELIKRKLKKWWYFIADINLYPKWIKPQSTNAFFGLNWQPINEITYPKDWDIINVHFKKAVDSTETLCSMNIVYHSRESIVSALEWLFTQYFFNDWQSYPDLLDNFMKDPQNAELNFSKAKPYLIIKNI